MSIQKKPYLSVAFLIVAVLSSCELTTVDQNRTDAPTFDPPGGSYSSDQSVTISSSTEGASIYYSIDGEAPTSESTVYSGPIAIGGHRSNRIIRAVAIAADHTVSDVSIAEFSINYAAMAIPTFAPGGGSYQSDQSVTISAAIEDAIIYFTIDGSMPSIESAIYSGPIAVEGDRTNRVIKAIAVSDGFAPSEIGSANYSIEYAVTAPPSFSPPAGAYSGNISVTLNTATVGAAIYFTTNGDLPSMSSIRYEGPIDIDVGGDGTTIKAVAISTAGVSSEFCEASYYYKYELGQEGPAGGIVFYDKGFYSDGWRWLEAAKNDLSAGIVFGWFYDAHERTMQGIGYGESNTIAIVNRPECGNCAASICHDLELGGFDDWFLPSSGELAELFRYDHLNSSMSSFLNFTYDLPYWTSSEHSYQLAYASRYADVLDWPQPMNHCYPVRPIRSF